MGARRFWTADSRRLAVLLLAVVAPPALMLVWLGTRLLDQDRSLVAQREVERRQVVAQNAARQLEQSLVAAERALRGDPLADDLVRFTITPQSLAAAPLDRVLWIPAPRAIPEASAGPFIAGERWEFSGDNKSALRSYEPFLASHDLVVRAGALLRVARIHRKEGRWNEALRIYDELGEIRAVALDATPVDLLARRATSQILEETHKDDALAREAAALESDFVAGRWALDRSAWELTAADIERWSGHRLRVSEQRKLLSDVADRLWAERSNRQDGVLSHRVVVTAGAAVTVLERLEEGKQVAVVIAPAVLERWAQNAVAAPGSSPGLTLIAEPGHLLSGPPPQPGALKLAASDTGLPWTLVLNPGDLKAAATELAGRRWLLAIGLASILLLCAGGTYFLWRVVRRELEVARLQADFVATVSHEFRTPLTSLAHMTELLGENDNLPEERRRSFYEALGRNTDRLRRLVESLLDFARMESGRKPFDRRPLDIVDLVTTLVEDFRRDRASLGHAIELDADVPLPARVAGDSASLTNAIWNLLDNATKYSPEEQSIHVSVTDLASGEVAISVEDHGLGIPADEKKRIFDRFVRGRQAQQLGIKGTGLGLAIVTHVVEAHGGRIEIDSIEGSGSTFTIALPAITRDSVPNQSLEVNAQRLRPARRMEPGA